MIKEEETFFIFSHLSVGKDYHNFVSDVRVLRNDKSCAPGGLNTEVPWLWPFLTNTQANH